jgi:fibronectin type 3 domain-containing protein
MKKNIIKYIIGLSGLLLLGFANTSKGQSVEIYPSVNQVVITVPPTYNPGQPFSISRAVGDSTGNYEALGTMKKAASLAEFRRTAGTEVTDALKKLLKLPSDDALWKFITANDSLKKYGPAAYNVPFLKAMGAIYIDKNIKSLSPGTKIFYKVTSPGKADVVTPGYKLGSLAATVKPELLESIPGDSVMIIKWGFKTNAHINHLPAYAVIYMEKSKGVFETMAEPLPAVLHNDTLTFDLITRVKPNLAYKFYLQPVNIWNDPLNITSDTTTFFSVNMKHLPPVTNLTAKDTIKGIWLQWKKVKQNLFVTGIAISRATAATGPFTVLQNVSATDSTFLDNTALQGTAYYYRMKTLGAEDHKKTDDKFTASATASHTDKKTKPTAPAGLTATTTADGVKLVWQPITNMQVAGYYVFRSPVADTANFTQISSLITATGYTDTTKNLSSRVLYNYSVKAVSMADIKSSYAPVAQAHLAQGNDKLATPAYLTINLKGNQALLEWQDTRPNDAFVAGYILFKRKKPARATPYDAAQKATAEAARLGFTRATPGIIKGAFYTDQLVNTNDEYEYAVAATDGMGGESGLSALAVTPAIVQTVMAPAKLFVHNVNNKIELAWLQADTTRITGYAIYRKIVGDKNYVKIATLDAQKNLYVDNSSEPGKQYIYRVKSVGSTGESAGFAANTFAIK